MSTFDKTLLIRKRKKSNTKDDDKSRRVNRINDETSVHIVYSFNQNWILDGRLFLNWKMDEKIVTSCLLICSAPH